jgi:hypothetical protein
MTRFRVYCEDCDFDMVFDDEDPPRREVRYWGSQKKAKQNWSGESAAKGKRDGHQASEFRNYNEGLRHRAHMEQVEP